MSPQPQSGAQDTILQLQPTLKLEPEPFVYLQKWIGSHPASQRKELLIRLRLQEAFKLKAGDRLWYACASPATAATAATAAGQQYRTSTEIARSIIVSRQIRNYQHGGPRYLDTSLPHIFIRAYVPGSTLKTFDHTGLASLFREPTDAEIVEVYVGREGLKLPYGMRPTYLSAAFAPPPSQTAAGRKAVSMTVKPVQLTPPLRKATADDVGALIKTQRIWIVNEQTNEEELFTIQIPIAIASPLDPHRRLTLHDGDRIDDRLWWITVQNATTGKEGKEFSHTELPRMRVPVTPDPKPAIKRGRPSST